MATRILSDLQQAVQWLREQGVRRLCTDSRRLQAGDAFIAWPGFAQDGRRYVLQCLARGATACLVEAEGVEAWGFDDSRIRAISGLKTVTGLLAAAFLDHPGEALQVVATTGTNGKTSTAWWTAQALGLAGRPCGVVGTLGIGRPPLPGGQAGQVVATGLTTPDPVVLQHALRDLADQGGVACALEASSIGIEEHRLEGLPIHVALFTNFTQDHLDYHGDMAAYWAAKRRLFSWPGLRAAVLNVDDPQGAQLVAELAGKGLQLWTCSLQGEARLVAQDLRHEAQGLSFTLCEGSQQVPVSTGLLGDFNASNLLVVIGALRALGLGLAEAAAAAARVTPVPGRLQRVQPGGSQQPEVVVDYAHTPDALEKAITALRPLAQARGGRLTVVFGCGGNRDATKRPLMGAIAARLADKVVITSDNPRDEVPADIIGQVRAGVPLGHAARQVLVEADRRLAVEQAVLAAEAADVVLVAGKGHEDYQEILGVKHPFSDLSVAAQALQTRESAR
ncbi:UDP-N-acetylmuramoyl-L-alanyl-D-glutamate--2,6-diaminopimelate ligase [Ideonella livida]|uniref:UDP-N-acetylmuramoyl-L-alanyl-D-glutamate--2,6-diaminopimelate ligase n=1 Tax=Ideonella livida TaxID=2707176 RepID=A0A7C9TK84_9BURK|nr:UDP-N-acetylmuramoyl-L-alanyl-D-glutamate--2,6-diaminopimelate ligase [Ideonella livida]NDY92278.1 UDP-N-acetylmuramoyl-L-alanyl-D-glutamate--2,6-diaminopimelate ligase [Ideonella livida]